MMHGTSAAKSVMDIQTAAARYGQDAITKIRNGKVAVAGLGGLGSNIAVMLARMGVGELLLVDFDVVQNINLTRQHYDTTHIGMFKTDAMKTQIGQINPSVHIETRNVRLTSENVSSIFSGYQIVCEALDGPSEKSMLITALMDEADRKVVAASGMAGFGSSNDIRTERRLNNLYICGDMATDAGPGVDLTAPRVMVCAAHQANMVLRLLLGMDEA